MRGGARGTRDRSPCAPSLDPGACVASLVRSLVVLGVLVCFALPFPSPWPRTPDPPRSAPSSARKRARSYSYVEDGLGLGLDWRPHGHCGGFPSERKNHGAAPRRGVSTGSRGSSRSQETLGDDQQLGIAWRGRGTRRVVGDCFDPQLSQASAPLAPPPASAPLVQPRHRRRRRVLGGRTRE